MGVGVAKTKEGAQVTIISTTDNGLYLRNGINLKANEIMVTGTGHAEGQQIVNFCNQRGWTLLGIGATLPVCQEICVPAIIPTGADIVTPIKGEHLRK